MHVGAVEGVADIRRGSTAACRTGLYQGFSAAAVASSLTIGVDARADLLHLAIVGQLDQPSAPLPSRSPAAAGGAAPAGSRRSGRSSRRCTRSSLELLARNHGGEIVHPLALPAGLQACRPVRIGRRVVAHVDRRWRALEDVELLRRTRRDAARTARRSRRCR